MVTHDDDNLYIIVKNGNGPVTIDTSVDKDSTGCFMATAASERLTYMLKRRKAAGKSQLPNPLKPLVELMGIEPTTL